MMQNIVVFGATGSIGCSTLDVIRIHPDKYQVFALTANNNLELLAKQCKEFNPKYAHIQNPDLVTRLVKLLKEYQVKTEVLTGIENLVYLASHTDVNTVMSAIVGSAGLLPTYHAAISGKRILLANKESLVAGGEIIVEAVKTGKAQLIPVDSEHSAIYQALPYNYQSLDQIGVNKIILTASGGPFLNMPQHELTQVTAAQAVKHPNWNMGQKISVDSATLMNKGLEVIEAYWLFGANYNQLDVIIHPQSIIHSMVEYIDGSIIAQLGTPDMKTPIAYALSAPQRISSGSKPLNFLELKALTFDTPDLTRFPCLKIALEGLKTGGCVPAVINASNEVAVAKFLNDEIKFYDIPRMIEKAINQFGSQKVESLNTLIEIDFQTRIFCQAGL